MRWGALEIAESYGPLLGPGLLSLDPPPVPDVDCGHCRRVEEGTAVASTKCCDTVPRLPNFLVGEILENGGSPVVEAWIADRRGDPFGLQVPPLILERYLAARRPGHFGDPCPLLTDGACSIYRMRPAACIDYHCHYETPFLRELMACLSSTLMLIERTTEKEIVLASDLDSMRIGHALNQDDLWSGTQHRPSIYDALWQSHRGREAAFYRWSYRSVLSRTAPAQVRPTAPSAVQRQRYLAGAVPAHLNHNSPETQRNVLCWYLQTDRVDPSQPHS